MPGVVLLGFRASVLSRRRGWRQGGEMTKKKAKALQFDRIGYWSEVKLDIIREYCSAEIDSP